LSLASIFGLFFAHVFESGVTDAWSSIFEGGMGASMKSAGASAGSVDRGWEVGGSWDFG